MTRTHKVTMRIYGAGLLILSFLCLELRAGEFQGETGRFFQTITTDRALYAPGETVQFTLTTLDAVPGNGILVRYRHLENTIEERSLTQSGDETQWTWSPPSIDFTGYLVELRADSAGVLLDRITIAVDVSSHWSRFPRYGFVSKFDAMSSAEMDGVISALNRFHINGIQFYDWHHKHHMPLKGTAQSPAETWIDIANRTIHLSTVKGYIEACHRYGMKAMAYNLLYGAWGCGFQEGVQRAWGIYKDTNHSDPLYLNMPSGWADDIYFMDPGNAIWRNYILGQTQKVFDALNFDGWHVDQIGDMGNTYNYSGERVRFKDAFKSFLEEAKQTLDVELVMNAVNQYGQDEIAKSPVEFLYSEVWDPNDSYAELAGITRTNLYYSDNRLNSVLPAYVNHGRSGSPGLMNEAAVLYADAVIFASGGTHLELGEHMLCHEYFPNDNLEMSTPLYIRLISYYDFLTAYQNLLRDDFRASRLTLSANIDISPSHAPALNSVWHFVMEKEDCQIVHLINFIGANSLSWRDNDGTQTPPERLENVEIRFSADRKIETVWFASPDINGGVPSELPFTQTGSDAVLTVPALEYWDMVVIRYESETAVETDPAGSCPREFQLGESYPNPFNGATRIPLKLSRASHVRLDIFNPAGRLVDSLWRGQMEAGEYRLAWQPAPTRSSGTYLCRCTLDDHFVKTEKLLYMK